jgi:hypothetical protein
MIRSEQRGILAVSFFSLALLKAIQQVVPILMRGRPRLPANLPQMTVSIQFPGNFLVLRRDD